MICPPEASTSKSEAQQPNHGYTTSGSTDENASGALPATASSEIKSLVKAQVEKVLREAGLTCPGVSYPAEITRTETEVDGQVSALLQSINPSEIADLVSDHADLDDNSKVKQSLSDGASHPSPAEEFDADGQPRFDSKGRRLFLPPKNTPSYDPTPLEITPPALNIKEEPKESSPQPAQPVRSGQGSSSSSLSYMPPGLAQISSLAPPLASSTSRSISEPSSSFKADTKPILGAKSVLGDLSESSSGEEGANVLGNILLAGSKTGVFGHVDVFQQELIKAKLARHKKFKGKKNKQLLPVKDEPCEVVPVKQEVVEPEVISLLDEDAQEESLGRAEEEQTKQREQEQIKFERNRQILVDFYKNKKLGVQSSPRRTPADEPAESEHEISKARPVEDEQAQHSSSDSESSASGRNRRRHSRRRHKKHKSSSQKRHRRSTSRERKERRRTKAKSRKKRRYSSYSDTSSGSSSEQSSSSSFTDSDEYYKRKKRKREKQKKRDICGKTKPTFEVISARYVPSSHSRSDKSQAVAAAPGIPGEEAKEIDEKDWNSDDPDFQFCMSLMDQADELNHVDFAKANRTQKRTPQAQRKINTGQLDSVTSEKSSTDNLIKPSMTLEEGKHERSSASKAKHHKHDKHRKSSREGERDHKEHHHRRRKSSTREKDSERPKKHADTSKHKSSSKTAKKDESEKKKSKDGAEASVKKDFVAGSEEPQEPTLPCFNFDLSTNSGELDFSFLYQTKKSGEPASNETAAQNQEQEEAVLGDSHGDADCDNVFSGDEDEEEMRRIFEEYKPKVGEVASLKKARRLEEENMKATQEIAETCANRKKRTAHSAANKSVSISKVAKGGKKAPRLTPSQQLMERYKKLKTQKEDADIDSKLKLMMDDDNSSPKNDFEKALMAGTTTPSVGGKKRLAHSSTKSNISCLTSKNKLKQQLEARKAATESHCTNKTVGHTIKGMPRIAHLPTDQKVLSRPIIAPDPHSKVPTEVRRRYLNSIIDDCLKIYHNDTLKAYSRAEKEEKECYDRSKSRSLYLNLVVHKLKNLRKEVKEAAETRDPSSEASRKSAQASTPVGRNNMLTTHMQVLAGKAGTVGTWSIERSKKPSSENPDNIPSDLYYAVMHRYALTPEQLGENGFPLPDPDEPGKAVVKEDQLRPRKPQPVDPFLRNCDRCLRTYRVNKEGFQVEEEECLYHWGRLYKRRGNRATGHVQTYSCCQGEANSGGCQVHQCHVTDILDFNDMRGFVETLSVERSKQPANGDYGIFALDCEMCNTVKGNELTRVTVINLDGKTVYEALVRPSNPIIDYNTRFSGIKAEDLEGVKTSLRDVQAVLLSMVNRKSILIGHSLESDLKALKLLHSCVVDTSVVFPHRLGPPYKRALKSLAADYLKKIIQNDVGGHDSAEDALTCLELMQMKVKEDVRKLKQVAREKERKLAGQSDKMKK